MSMQEYKRLWQAICAGCDAKRLDRVRLIEHLGQIQQIQARREGKRYSDAGIWEGAVKAILSNATEWRRVERTFDELEALLRGFDPAWYAELEPDDVTETLVPWFKERRAGSMTLRRSLTQAISAARLLLERSATYSGLEGYLEAILAERDGDAIALAVALGTPGPHKLPAFGIPIAAEFLKNIGFDVAKPDRHVNRALGAFGLQNYRKWPDRSARKAPEASPPKQEAVMRRLAEMATSLGIEATILDNTIWLLCAQSGGALSNTALKSLAADSA